MKGTFCADGVVEFMVRLRRDGDLLGDVFFKQHLNRCLSMSESCLHDRVALTTGPPGQSSLGQLQLDDSHKKSNCFALCSKTMLGFFTTTSCVALFLFVLQCFH